MPGRTINTRYVTAAVTIPAGTAIAAPVDTAVPVGDVIADELRIRFPPGPSGLVGLRVLYDGAQLIPWGPFGGWLIADDERFDTVLDFEVGHPLVVRGYNTDVFDHTIQLLVKTSDIAAPYVVTPTVAPLAL